MCLYRMPHVHLGRMARPSDAAPLRLRPAQWGRHGRSSFASLESAAEAQG